MLNKTVVSVLSVLICLFCSTEQATVKVSIFYETLCHHSKEFIINQFYPVYKEIGKEYIDVDFVPYGHATETKENDTWNFICQHGVPECFGNIYHSCALALNSEKDATSNFVYCSMSEDPTSEKSLEECSKRAGLSWEDINNCYHSEQAVKFYHENGEKTRAVEDTKYLPAILLNDKFDETYRQRALADFTKLICDVLNNELEICNM